MTSCGKKYTAIYINEQKVRDGDREPLLRLAAIPLDFTDKTVLDLGCNCGGMLFALTHKIKHGYGMDISKEAIAEAQALQHEHAVANLTFTVGDLRQCATVPLPPADIVCMFSLARWVATWKAVLRRIRPPTLVFEAHGDDHQRKCQAAFLRSLYTAVQHLTDTKERFHRTLYLCTGLTPAEPHWESLLGPRLGGGGCRDVYAHATDPNLVIKVEKDRPDHGDQNRKEYDNWQRLQENPVQTAWLTPCETLSAGEKYLVQRRGQPLTPTPPANTPKWLRRDPDIGWRKHSQWVLYDGSPRLCDYGRIPFAICFDEVYGEKLYSGRSRTVYAHATDPNLVIKVENKKPAVPGKNVQEYERWQQLQNTPAAAFLAPCLGLYDNGRYLIQQRGIPAVVREIS